MLSSGETGPPFNFSEEVEETVDEGITWSADRTASEKTDVMGYG